jgi:CheY-like chemotaxis protein
VIDQKKRNGGKMVKTVMIIASDASTRYLLRRYLEEGGFQAVMITRRLEAVNLLSQSCPLALIAELELSQVADWHKFNQLKSDPVLNQIPLIICTWQPEEEFFLLAGKTGYLQKPIFYEAFLAALAQFGEAGG